MVRIRESKNINPDSGFAFPLYMLLGGLCIILSLETEFPDRIIGKVQGSDVHGRRACSYQF